MQTCGSCGERCRGRPRAESQDAAGADVVKVHIEGKRIEKSNKTGLQRVPGELYLADIGIPAEVFQRLGLSFELIFGGCYWVRLEISDGQ